MRLVLLQDKLLGENTALRREAGDGELYLVLRLDRRALGADREDGGQLALLDLATLVHPLHLTGPAAAVVKREGAALRDVCEQIRKVDQIEREGLGDEGKAASLGEDLHRLGLDVVLNRNDELLGIGHRLIKEG